MNMNVKTDDLIKRLAVETNGVVFVVWHHGDGCFVVLCEHHNVMKEVRGTQKPTLRESVVAAIHALEQRETVSFWENF